jgi:hypothetical protein
VRPSRFKTAAFYHRDCSPQIVGDWHAQAAKRVDIFAAALFTGMKEKQVYSNIFGGSSVRLSPVPLERNTEPDHRPNLRLFAPACFCRSRPGEQFRSAFA